MGKSFYTDFDPFLYMNRYDVIIIGAGITGLMTAYKLAHHDLKIIVVEANPEPGWGVSKGHAAVVHVVQLPFSSKKSKMAREGNKMMEDICRELGVRLERTSTLIVATKIHHLLALPFMALYLRLNLGRDFPVKLRGRRYLRHEEPNLTERALGAIEIYGYGVVDSFDLIYALYEFSAANGAEFLFGERVIDVEIGNDEIKVKTDKDRLLTSNFLVNAGGLWADEIAGLTGDEITFELGKGVILVFDRRQTKRLISPAYLKPDPKTKGGAIMFTVEGRGLWGPNLRTAKNKEDVTVEEEDIKALTDKFGPLLKEDLGISIKAYAGIRPIPPENDFRITYSSRSRRIVHILGTESPAYTASPAIAEKVVSMLASSGLRLVPKKKVFPREPFPRIRDNPEGGRGEIVCLCSMVTEEEIREAVRRGSKTLQGVMFRTGAGMGICQGGRCMAEIVRIIAEELGIDVKEVTLRGGNTWIVRK